MGSFKIFSGGRDCLGYQAKHQNTYGLFFSHRQKYVINLSSTLNYPNELDEVFVPIENHPFILMFSTMLSKIFMLLT